MSFDVRKETVEEGDTVVLYMGCQSLLAFEVHAGKTNNTKFGTYPHNHLIGKLYGSKVFSTKGRGWVYVLHPTPELWTLTLPHRTQILYTTDISMIVFELELKPGSIVIESGTGSGSLSHAIIRAVKPDGHLYTFDFHQNRVTKAREEFDNHGIGRHVSSACADVCMDGFSITDKADAVFLDLPSPWDAIPHAKKALKKSGGRICSFSPCIEQVQRTCNTLRSNQFCDIKTIECLVQNLIVSTVPIPEFTFEDVMNDTEQKGLKKQKFNTSMTPDEISTNCSETAEMVENGGEKLDPVSNAKVGNGSEEDKNITGLNSYKMVNKLTAKCKKGNINVLTSKPKKEVAGHTGYLTFASLYPF